MDGSDVDGEWDWVGGLSFDRLVMPSLPGQFPHSNLPQAFIASYLRPPGRHRTGRRGFEHGAGPAIGELGRGGRRSTGWETTDNEEDASDTSR